MHYFDPAHLGQTATAGIDGCPQWGPHVGEGCDDADAFDDAAARFDLLAALRCRLTAAAERLLALLLDYASEAATDSGLGRELGVDRRTVKALLQALYAQLQIIWDAQEDGWPSAGPPYVI